jgi:hypothetical protein
MDLEQIRAPYFWRETSRTRVVHNEEIGGERLTRPLFSYVLWPIRF